MSNEPEIEAANALLFACRIFGPLLSIFKFGKCAIPLPSVVALFPVIVPVPLVMVIATRAPATGALFAFEAATCTSPRAPAVIAVPIVASLGCETKVSELVETGATAKVIAVAALLRLVTTREGVAAVAETSLLFTNDRNVIVPSPLSVHRKICDGPTEAPSATNEVALLCRP